MPSADSRGGLRAQVEVSMPRHVKFRKLGCELGIPRMHALGLHVALIAAVTEEAPDGHLSGWEPVDVAERAFWDGDPDELVEALVKVRLLDRDEDGLHIHDWREHTGGVLWKRAGARERKRRERAARDSGEAGEKKDEAAQAAGVTDACDSHAPKNSDVTHGLDSTRLDSTRRDVSVQARDGRAEDEPDEPPEPPQVTPPAPPGRVTFDDVLAGAVEGCEEFSSEAYDAASATWEKFTSARGTAASFTAQRAGEYRRAIREGQSPQAIAEAVANLSDYWRESNSQPHAWRTLLDDPSSVVDREQRATGPPRKEDYQDPAAYLDARREWRAKNPKAKR